MNKVEGKWQEIIALMEKKSSIDNIFQVNQTELLQAIIKLNQNTEYGKKYRFAEIKNYQNYAESVPIVNYTDVAESFEKTAKGQNNLVTSEHIECFETTSGSEGKRKLIPYTPKAINAFQQGIFPWIIDLLKSRPNISKGRAYFAISPVFRSQSYTSGGFRIGIDSDSSYFGQEIEPLLQDVLIVSNETTHDIEKWRQITAALLMQTKDLSFISVWSPTFLLSILEEMAKQCSVNLDALDTKKLWPNLDTISCWMSASSTPFAKQLQALFPHVSFQGKGLLATEGILSFPHSASKAPLLATNSGFFEFKDSEGNIRLSADLERGKEYEVIVTNYSGLYRYNIGDRIRVTDYYRQIPTIEFVGRAGVITDLCGEKLTETCVSKALSALHETLISTAVLVPIHTPKPHYCLYVDDYSLSATTQAQLVKELDNSLKNNNLQYDYARKLNQLGDVELKISPNIIKKYTSYWLKQHKCFGAMKPPILLTENIF